jgi:hypothetical protein
MRVACRDASLSARLREIRPRLIRAAAVPRAVSFSRRNRVISAQELQRDFNSIKIVHGEWRRIDS